ncbi:outer membrane beta-barrel protein [Tenacibaculum jejuense]|uniref:Uncharacterized protein n=1 Tax=Tenacibaculum jejuense TaxID=584609 RepID=A0A238U8F9_9FLAO|nr:outer membrane beta-barrel protein [Tenacibaculum jejuense]SNR15479.1 conserved exported protein of unknown function [Tenacibaculum jejuense]
MKKNIIAVLAFTICIFSVKAQEENKVEGFQKNDVYISGRVSYGVSFLSDSGRSSEAFIFAPSVGYFVSDKIALDLGVVFSSSFVENSFLGQQEKKQEFGFRLGGDYYFTPQKRFSFLIGADLFFNNVSYESGVLSDENQYGINISPGLNYFISKSFSINASVGSLGYVYTKSESDFISGVSTFVFDLNLSSIVLGLTYRF